MILFVVNIFFHWKFQLIILTHGNFLICGVLNYIVSLFVTVTYLLSGHFSLIGGINRDYAMKRGIEFSNVDGDATAYGADLQRYDLGMDYHVFG